MSLATADQPRRHRLTVSDYYRMAEVGEPLGKSALPGAAVDMKRLFDS